MLNTMIYVTQWRRWGEGRVGVKQAVKKNTFLSFLTFMGIFLEALDIF